MPITLEEFLKLNNPNVIDIRIPQKYNDNHIKGAINISANSLINNPDKFLRRDLTYYIYCQKGNSSKTLSEILRAKGYSVYSIIGGYEEWILNS